MTYTSWELTYLHFPGRLGRWASCCSLIWPLASGGFTYILCFAPNPWRDDDPIWVFFSQPPCNQTFNGSITYLSLWCSFTTSSAYPSKKWLQMSCKEMCDHLVGLMRQNLAKILEDRQSWLSRHWEWKRGETGWQWVESANAAELLKKEPTNV